MAKKSQNTEPQRIKIHWRNHDDQSVRVWRDGWAGDQFEVISKPGFATFLNIGERLNAFEVIQAEDD